MRRESKTIWNDRLSKIEVEGGTEAQRTKFYTDLWHALLGRRTVSDVNGKYSDMTGAERKIRQIPLNNDGVPLYRHYNTDAFWGTQWNLNILWSFAYPGIMNQFCNFLVDFYKNGGLIPRGPSGGNYTYVMSTATSTPFIAAAYMKGIRNFDVETAYEGMRKNAFPGGLISKAGYEHFTSIGGGAEYYVERGYIPEGLKAEAYHVSGAGQTLECAYQDWCLAQMARALGKDEDYRLFMRRAENYRKLFDSSTGFMRPRSMDGSWLTPFDPMGAQGWVEGNAWQFTWFVPHDIRGLTGLMGGTEIFTDKLNLAFEKAVPDNFVTPHGKEAVNYVNYGNQPSTQVAHLFNYSGAPWLTQKWVREVKEKAHGDVTPYGGYRGDEDQGQMGGLGVLMAMGLFELRGGAAMEPVYEITSPLFDKITIHLDPKYYKGEKFEIIAKNNSKRNRYIQSAVLNGESLNRPWFYHRQMIEGGTLILDMGPEPNKEWGSRPEDAPPSMTDERH